MILWPPGKTMVPITTQANASDDDGAPVQLTVATTRNESQKEMVYRTAPATDQSAGIISLSSMVDHSGTAPAGSTR